MSKITYTYTMGANSVAVAIGALEKRIGTLNTDVQKVAVSILLAFKASGDKPTVERHANALVKALGKGMRSNSMLAWFEQNAPMTFNKETKLLVCGVTAASPVKEHSKIAAQDVLAKAMWFDAAPPEAYKPLADWNAALMQLVKRAEKDIAEMGEKSKVNADQLAALRTMASAI